MIPDCIGKEDFLPRATLGQQVLDIQNKYAGQKTQTVRETTDEMGKKYMASLWKLIEDHKDLIDAYYIMEIITHDTFLEGVIKVKHIARKTRPKPEWGVGLYKVDNKAEYCSYEWGLPNEAEAFTMMQNPAGWDQKTIKDISDFIAGRLE